jgi:hypothetical protein
MTKVITTLKELSEVLAYRNFSIRQVRGITTTKLQGGTISVALHGMWGTEFVLCTDKVVKLIRHAIYWREKSEYFKLLDNPDFFNEVRA